MPDAYVTIAKPRSRPGTESVEPELEEEPVSEAPGYSGMAHLQHARAVQALQCFREMCLDALIPVLVKSLRMLSRKVLLACQFLHMFCLHIEKRPVGCRSADPVERNQLEAAIEGIEHCVSVLAEFRSRRRRNMVVCQPLEPHRVQGHAMAIDADNRPWDSSDCHPRSLSQLGDLERRLPVVNEDRDL